MTTPASPVFAVPGFVIDATTSAGPEYIKIYTVQSAAPERIEAVYMTLDYGASEPTYQRYALELRDPSGVVVFAQPTPTLTTTDTNDLTVILCWSRQANDTAQQPFSLFDDPSSSASIAWANLPLPDLVLQPSSTVQFVNYSFFEVSAGTIPVSNASVTVTRNAGAVSATSPVAFPEPYLIPTTG